MSTEENPVRIRTARPYDAAALLDLKRQLDEETAFMMCEPGERDSSVQDLARELADAAGRGIGTGLLRHARDWAAAHGLHRLELTVMARNTRAIRLYERMGFSVEGGRPGRSRPLTPSRPGA